MLLAGKTKETSGVCESESRQTSKLTWLRRRRSMGEERDWKSSSSTQTQLDASPASTQQVPEAPTFPTAAEVTSAATDEKLEGEGVGSQSDAVSDANREALHLNVVPIYAEEGIPWSPGTVRNQLQMRFESLASPDVTSDASSSPTSSSLTSPRPAQVLFIDRKKKAVQRTQSLRTPRDRKSRAPVRVSPLTRSTSFKDDLRLGDATRATVSTSRKSIVIISKSDNNSTGARDCDAVVTSSSVEGRSQSAVEVVASEGEDSGNLNNNEADEVSVKNLCNRFELTTTTTTTSSSEKPAPRILDAPASQPATPQTSRRSAPSCGVGDNLQEHQRRVQHGRTHPLARLSHADGHLSINRNKFYSTM